MFDSRWVLNFSTYSSVVERSIAGFFLALLLLGKSLFCFICILHGLVRVGGPLLSCILSFDSSVWSNNDESEMSLYSH